MLPWGVFCACKREMGWGRGRRPLPSLAVRRVVVVIDRFCFTKRVLHLSCNPRPSKDFCARAICILPLQQQKRREPFPIWGGEAWRRAGGHGRARAPLISSLPLFLRSLF